MPRRYVLFASETELSEEDMKALEEIVELRYGKVKIIPLKGNPKSVVIKTTNLRDRSLREDELVVKGNKLHPVLTSGVIGKLKRAASASRDDAR